MSAYRRCVRIGIIGYQTEWKDDEQEKRVQITWKLQLKGEIEEKVKPDPEGL